MSDRDSPFTDGSDAGSLDTLTARLVRLGGPRLDLPADSATRIRRAFLDECRSVAGTRRLRRRVWVGAAVLAAAATVIVALRITAPRTATAPVRAEAGQIDRLAGSGAGVRAPRDAGPGVRATPATVVRIGDLIETDGDGRVGLRLRAGVSVRFDQRSAAAFVSERAIELRAGAIYVDSGPGAVAIAIHTPAGVVHDIGTQFEVRLDGTALRVRVRSGLVEIARGGTRSRAAAGFDVVFTTDGERRQAIAPYDPAWAWAAAVGPYLEVEGRTLSSVLGQICREQGWALTYSDPALAGSASRIILHGSSFDQPPLEAVATVLATAGLTHRLDAGTLAVSRVASP